MNSVHYENDLPHEFPEFHHQLHQLKMTDAHFRKLFDAYDTLSKELHRIENGVETPDDAYTETCKKKRLKLKDEIFALLKQAA